METIDCRPDTQERYTSAITSGNLKSDTREGAPVGPTDVLMAAGWSASQFGMGMLRLHSEWDSAEKPARPTKALIEALAATYAPALPRVKGRKDPRIARASAAANVWHLAEMGKLLGKLHMLPRVRHELMLQAMRWRIADSEGVVPAVIKYWLEQNCGACGGLKHKLVTGTAELSSRVCHVCHGSGIGAVPYGQEGRRLCNYIDDCVMYAQQSLKKRLRNTK